MKTIFFKLLASIVLVSFGNSNQDTLNLYFEQHEESLTKLFKTQIFPQISPRLFSKLVFPY